jgi:hypothetical protein
MYRKVHAREKTAKPPKIRRNMSYSPRQNFITFRLIGQISPNEMRPITQWVERHRRTSLSGFQSLHHPVISCKTIESGYRPGTYMSMHRAAKPLAFTLLKLYLHE